MPAGLAKVLEILNGSLSLSNPDGELVVNATEFVVENASAKAELVANYIDANGIYAPEQITISSQGSEAPSGDILDKKSKVFKLAPGNYSVKAGGYTQDVKVNIANENK